MKVSDNSLKHTEEDVDVGSLNLELDFDSPVQTEVPENDLDFFSDVKEEREMKSLLKPKAGRIVLSVFYVLIFCGLFTLIIYNNYMNRIKYPEQEVVEYSKTGMYCLENWVNSLVALSPEYSGDAESYIAKEVVYANGNKYKLDFISKVLGTIKYEPYQVKAKNIYGNDMIDRNTDEVVYIDSYVSKGEAVRFSHITYDRIQIDDEKVKRLLEEEELKVGDVDYSNKLVNVFCRYMSELDWNNVPVITRQRIPCMEGTLETGYTMLQDEEIYIDKLLFSSDSFYNLVDRFSLSAYKAVKDKEMKPKKKWRKWNKKPYAERRELEEPVKYNPKNMCSKIWCGTYYLQNEYTTVDENGNIITGIRAELGDGTFENPASYNTGIITYVLKNEKNEQGEKELVKYPIKVELIEYGVSEDAITWFENKDIRNRGIDITSEVQYCYYVFRVTNMSDKELTIKDNSAICDKNANLSPRTGELYGLQNKVKLQPDEVGIIETWNKSTELNKKYIIWGKDFKRREEPVWFRFLAGDLEDNTEEKGVTLNKTRHGDDIESTETQINTEEVPSTE